MQVRSPVAFIMAASCLTIPLSAFAQSDDGRLPAGIWRSQGYGYIVHVQREQVQTFDITSTTCVRGPRYTRSEFRDHYGEAQDVGASSATLLRSPTRDLLERLDAMPTSCRRPLRSRDSATNLDVFTQTFAELSHFLNNA